MVIGQLHSPAAISHEYAPQLPRLCIGVRVGSIACLDNAGEEEQITCHLSLSLVEPQSSSA